MAGAVDLAYKLTGNHPHFHPQSAELEYRRHELLGRLHKDTNIELEIIPNGSHNQHSPNSTSPEYSGDGHNNNNVLNYNNNNPLMINANSGGTDLHSSPYEPQYGKEPFYGLKAKDIGCGEQMDDAFLRPPLWEDITSSIQNIDPENAMMLASLPSATQVSRLLLRLSNGSIIIDHRVSSLRLSSWSGETGGQR